jgi:hypothetical protein
MYVARASTTAAPRLRPSSQQAPRGNLGTPSASAPRQACPPLRTRRHSRFGVPRAIHACHHRVRADSVSLASRLHPPIALASVDLLSSLSCNGAPIQFPSPPIPYSSTSGFRIDPPLPLPLLADPIMSPLALSDLPALNLLSNGCADWTDHALGFTSMVW